MLPGSHLFVFVYCCRLAGLLVVWVNIYVCEGCGRETPPRGCTSKQNRNVLRSNRFAKVKCRGIQKFCYEPRVRKIFPDPFTCIGFHSFLRSRVPIDSRESVSSEDNISTYAFTYIQI